MAKLFRIGLHLLFWEGLHWEKQIKAYSWVSDSNASFEWERLNDWFDKSLVTLLSVINFIFPRE